MKIMIGLSVSDRIFILKVYRICLTSKFIFDHSKK